MGIKTLLGIAKSVIPSSQEKLSENLVLIEAPNYRDLHKFFIPLEEFVNTFWYDVLFDLYHNHHSSPKDILWRDLPRANYFIAVSKGKLLGMTSYRWMSPTLAMTERTIVYPKYRGSGVGREISKQMEEFLRKEGAHKICCEILSENKKMLSIKLGQGYEVEGYMRNHDASGVHQYFLGKLLT